VSARRCLVNGAHTPGSKWEAECPVLRAQKADDAAAHTVVAGDPELASGTRMNSGDSDRVSVTRRPPGPRRGGRPRKFATAALAHAAAQRAYRERRHAARVAALDALVRT
jgi:hypothetical protein